MVRYKKSSPHPMKNTRAHSDGTPVSQEEILTLLAGMTKELAGLHATAIKYPILKKILAEAATRLPADTRLPGIRDLALQLGISLVTAQRAVAELTDEGVLYSRPRSGVFVQNQERAASAASASAGGTPSHGTQHPFRAVFEFGTDSVAPYQKKFWEETAELFSSHHPNITPQIRFESRGTEHLQSLDAHERYDRDASADEKETLLNIADFAGDLMPVAPLRDRLLPLYYRTYFLFWNRELLERHHLPPPDYRTFAEQTEYLRRIAPELERLGLHSQPYSIQEPVTLFGPQIAQFGRLLHSEHPDPQRKAALAAMLERVLSFCRLLRYSIADRDNWIQARHDFLKGREPFFLGYSVNYWEFSRKQLPFDWKAYPTLCCDDSLFLWPRVGVISSRSDHPVESMQFLLFLLRPEIQQRFAETGNFGAGLTPGLSPAMRADPDWITAALAKSSPFQLPSREDYYMAVNVLGGAVWRSLVEKVSAGDTLEQALQMGRSYLQHRPAKPMRMPGG